MARLSIEQLGITYTMARTGKALAAVQPVYSTLLPYGRARIEFSSPLAWASGQRCSQTTMEAIMMAQTWRAYGVTAACIPGTWGGRWLTHSTPASAAM